jgi:hypothetical protein
MSKYDALKFLKETRARIAHACDSCRAEIEKGEIYYCESIGKVNAPHIRLRKFCRNCFEKEGGR